MNNTFSGKHFYWPTRLNVNIGTLFARSVSQGFRMHEGSLHGKTNIGQFFD